MAVTGARFREHPNVVDLVFYRCILRIMQEFHCGFMAAVDWYHQAEEYDRQQNLMDRKIIWVDEATYWNIWENPDVILENPPWNR